LKKLIPVLLIIILVFGLCACGETEPAESPEPTAQTDTDDLSAYTKEDGRLKTVTSYSANGLLFSTEIYEYDGAGNVIKVSSYGVNDVPDGYESYEYDKSGNKTMMISYASDGNDGYTEELRTCYTYGKNGVLLSEMSLEGSKTVRVTNYEYGEDGLLTGQKVYDGENNIISQSAYEYDAEGRLIRSENSEYETGSSYVETYTYTDAGLRSGLESRSDDGSLIYRIELSYDEYGNQISLNYYSSDNELVSSTSYEYTYDVCGNIKRSVISADGTQGATTEYQWEYSKG